MILFKRILSQLHRYVVWALVSALICGFVFFRVTDAKKEKKITIYARVPSVSCEELSLELEKNKPEGIKLINVHHFSYDLFGMDVFESGDVFIISKSDAELYRANLCEIAGRGENDLIIDGKVCGWLFYDAESRSCPASSYFDFTFYEGDGYANEDYYICFNKDSVHIGDINGSADDAAIQTAEHLLSLK
ncbi:MAG: hypothetical protein K6G56_06610 [Clostridiales bacterium]|nr:hypothetical protein [Clostridiales bacterium]